MEMVYDRTQHQKQHEICSLTFFDVITTFSYTVVYPFFSLQINIRMKYSFNLDAGWFLFTSLSCVTLESEEEGEEKKKKNQKYQKEIGNEWKSSKSCFVMIAFPSAVLPFEHLIYKSIVMAPTPVIYWCIYGTELWP
jgi:hypothetical protein